MADKKLNEVSTLTDFDYALVVKGNDVAKVTKQQLATILGGLSPFITFIRPNKLYMNYNISSGNIPKIVDKGVYLIVVYDVNNPNNVCYVAFCNTSSPGEFVPNINTVINKGGISIGWKNTLQFPEGDLVVNIATYKLG